MFDPAIADAALADATDLWQLLWPAVAIALLRIGDVSLNVFKTVFVVQQRRWLAATTSGLEAGTWLAAAGIVFADMTPLRTAGFVVGVAAGTFVGVQLTGRLRLGMATVRVYADATRCDEVGRPLDLGHGIARAIHAAGFGATVFRGTGYKGDVDMVLATVRRRDADRVLAIARAVDEQSFAAIDNAVHPAPVPGVTPAGRV
ncbi:DUF5698 domain-containing protein [Egicoccus halophilus]|uniref:DUF5698 domain-containing protein n=1 Tax=Egicoccus halophilus TaxID=1670830 RepID=A0A8J3ES99_9ACTN|nr:DUF5698 domain-containing protein [Egicoccus halophilus]GGI06881.1 hypothetical protein GCM10011354_21310 [Egicoccus halophilus]